MQRRDAEPLDRAAVLGRRVADVLGELPPRMGGVGPAHVPVAGLLGDHRRRGDRGALGVAVDHGALVVPGRPHREPVAQADTARAGHLGQGVAQGEPALRLMGADPVRIKQWAFGIATGVSALAGAMLIIVSPVEPAMDRLYIGRTFCVVVLAGLGSMTGTLAAGLIAQR